MKTKLSVNLAMIAAVVALAASGSSVQADPFAFLGTVHAGDQLQLKYNGEENVPTAGNFLYGVEYVTSIFDLTTQKTVWAEGLGGQGQIAGFFNNYLTNPPTGSPPNVNFTFTGGDTQLFYNPTVVHNVVGSMGTNAAPDANGTYVVPGSTLWADFKGIPGIISGDPNVTLNSTATSATSPLTGTGDGYVQLIGGTFASYVGLGAKGFLQSDFAAPSTTPGSDWPASNHDPVTVTPATFVPEPSSLALMSLGMISLLGLSRKIRRRKDVVA